MAHSIRDDGRGAVNPGSNPHEAEIENEISAPSQMFEFTGQNT